MKLMYLAISIFLLSVWSTTTVADPLAQPSPCVAIHGMYVYLGMGPEGILGNTEKERSLLEFARNNGFNYLIFYSLEGINTDADRQTQLAALITRGRQDYGLYQIGAALGSAAAADGIADYNRKQPPQARVDVLNLELEFWNAADRQQSFALSLTTLAHFREIADRQQLVTEIYIGWITEQEGVALANAVDRVLVHYYRKNDTGIIQYGLERLKYLAKGNSRLLIAPIFSNEGPQNSGDPSGYFMGPWLADHSISQPYQTWFGGYKELAAEWQKNLRVMGSVWFLYNYFADIDYSKPVADERVPMVQHADIAGLMDE